jgi:hypothetical protein
MNSFVEGDIELFISSSTSRSFDLWFSVSKDRNDRNKNTFSSTTNYKNNFNSWKSSAPMVRFIVEDATFVYFIFCACFAAAIKSLAYLASQ